LSDGYEVFFVRRYLYSIAVAFQNFVESSEAFIVQGRLKDRPIVLVSIDTTPDDLSDAVSRDEFIGRLRSECCTEMPALPLGKMTSPSRLNRALKLKPRFGGIDDGLNLSRRSAP